MKINTLLVFLVLTGFSFAQEKNTEIKTWSLADCIDYAKEKSITVSTASLAVKTAEVNYQEAKSSRLPDLTATISQSYSSGNTIDLITSDYVSQNVYAAIPKISTSLDVYKGHQIKNQIAANKLLVDQNSLYLEEAKNSIALSVTEAYITALYDKEAITIAENTLVSSENEVARAKARYDAGSVAMIDYTDALSQAATNKYNVISAKNTYAQQIIILKQLLELEPEESFEMTTPDTENVVIGMVPDKESVYNTALHTLPEIKSSLINKSVYEKELDVAKGVFLPTLSLTGSLGSGYTTSDSTNFNDQLNLNYNKVVGLSLSVPIFNKYATKASVQKAKIDIETAELDIQTARKDLYKKIATSWQNLTSYQEQLLATKAASDAAYESFKLAQKKYELNALSTTDLVISQNTYTNAQQNYIQAKYLTILYYQLVQFYQGNEIKL
jgi:outer membrane protein